MSDVIADLNAPWLLWILAGSTVAYTVLRQLAESSTAITKLLGPLGRRWQDARLRRNAAAAIIDDMRAQLAKQSDEIDELRDRYSTDAWIADLRRQIEALDKAVKELRRRGQIVDAYLVYDEEWHRTELLRHGASDYVMSAHKSYLEFEADWLAAKRHRHRDQEG